MEIKVRKIPSSMGKEWFLNKHYARVCPSVILALYGLFIDNRLRGVCSFSPPPRMFNNGEHLFDDYTVDVMELSRVVIDDDLPKNTLSKFVSSVCKMLPSPTVLVSFADSNAGHHGYIYQALNWLYLGQSNPRRKFVNENGKQVHERTMQHQKENPQNVTVQTQQGKYRYLNIIGNRREKRKMMSNLLYDVLEYPKGENKRYDSSCTPSGQMSLI